MIRPVRKGFTSAEVEAEQARGGKPSLRQVIGLRVRCLSDGAVLGGAAFVDRVYARHRRQFGLKRRKGAKPVEDADWEGLCVLRDLKRDRVG